MTDEEWGPWVSHDQNGCPVPDGTIVELYCVFPPKIKFQGVGKIGIDYTREKWNDLDRDCKFLFNAGAYSYPIGILKYRIKKPKGLTILEGLLVKLPETVEELA